jgi:hypothetical protein
VGLTSPKGAHVSNPRRSRLNLVAIVALVLSALPALVLAAPAAEGAGPAVTGALWTESAQKPLASLNGHRRTVHPSTYEAYTLNAAAMNGLLANAPLERSASAQRSGVKVEVPGPTGELIEFAVVESPILEDGLAAAHPEISTYAGSSVTEGYAASIRLDVTPQGFHASVSDGKASWYVDPAYLGDDSLYLSYFGAALPVPERGLVEPELDEGTEAKVARAAQAPTVGEGPGALVKQRVYRLALVTDRSYAEYFAPGLNDGAHEAESNAAVLAAKTTLMNRVNQIYNDDLAIKMVLVANSDLLNLNTTTDETNAGFPASGSGSIASGCTSALLTRNQTAVDTIIGSANYDVGHIALGINGGGIASLGVVGRNGVKGRGCTGLPTPVGDFMAIDYVAHEIGHQFDGNHTFNSLDCSGNRNASTSVEPGSGSSVMAYAGICAEDDLQPHTDPYFSQRTQTEVSAYINGANTDNRDGFQVITTPNHNPAVTAPAAKTIPIRTPFTLTGSATDSDSNPLVYLWEQNDNGATSQSLIAATKLTGPLFRVFGKYADVSNTNTLLYNSPGENLATTSPSRTFPDMAQIVAGSTNAATGSCPASSATTALPDGPTLECHSESLPTALYTPTSMTFRLTARDQVVDGGGTDFADVVLTLDKTKGPFLVSSPNTAVSYVGGSTQTVTWTSGMDTLSANVKISLSTDGGLTYPAVISASTPNDGTQSVTIPNVPTTTARIKVEAVENYFFDISDADFTITPGAPTGLAVTQPANPTQSVQYSDPIAGVGISATTDQPSGVLAASIDAGTPLPAGLSLSARSGTDAAASWTVSGTANVAPGVYDVTAMVTDGTTTTDVPLTFTVTQENATPTYTGDTSKAAAAGQDHVDVNLAATVVDAADGNLGDLANATATFVDTATSTTLCSSPVTSGGAASCTYNAAAPGSYQVKVDVGGRFTGTTAADTTLTVTTTTTPPAVPETQLTSGPATWLLDAAATYVFASSIPGSTFTCGFDGAPAPCASPTTWTGLAAGTHVFMVAATKDGQTDATPARSVTTVPVDDTVLKAKAGDWKRKKSKRSFLGTYSTVKEKGAVLKYKVRGARALALVASTSPKAGKVKVYLGKKRIATVNLKGPKKSKVVFDLATLLVPTNGKLTIVTASKRPVRIDGLGVASTL